MVMNNINQYTIWKFLRNYILYHQSLCSTNIPCLMASLNSIHMCTILSQNQDSSCLLAIAESLNYVHYVHPDRKLLPYPRSFLQHFLNNFSRVQTSMVELTYLYIHIIITKTTRMYDSHYVIFFSKKWIEDIDYDT